jgi:hypothetical protein
MSDPLKFAKRLFEDELGFKIIEHTASKHLKMKLQRPDGSTFLHVSTRSPGDYDDYRRWTLRFIKSQDRRS